jgi:glutamate:GABA antiporter
VKPQKTMGVFLIVMLISGSIDSIRNLPATALFGSTLIFFFVLATVFFLVPSAFVSAQLSALFKDEGGIYQWVKKAFGTKLAFLAIWLQWINTMVWYPTILSFIAGTFAYFINPSLAHDKAYLVSVILIVFWVMTLLNLKGIVISAKFSAVCAVVGMMIPMLLIMGLGVVWLCQGQPIALHFTVHDMIPHVGHFNSWISLTAMITAFLGMELATVHVKQVSNPQKTFPKALAISCVLIMLTMVLGALSIAIVVPASKMNLVDGVMEAFSHFLHIYHVGFLVPVMAVMLILGSLGSMVNWLVSPAKGLTQAAQYGYLPKWLSKETSKGVPKNMLIVQAVLVSVLCTAFLFVPSVNGAYWLLTDLSTELYVLMYVLMFIAAIVLFSRHLKKGNGFLGQTKSITLCVMGVVGSVVTLVVGFFPPSGIHAGHHYALMFGIGLLVMCVPAFLIMILVKPNNIA